MTIEYPVNAKIEMPDELPTCKSRSCGARAMCYVAAKASGGQRGRAPLIMDSCATWHTAYVFATEDADVLQALKSYTGRAARKSRRTIVGFSIQVNAGQCLREAALLTGKNLANLANLPEVEVTLFCWERPELGRITYLLRFD